MLSTVKNTQSDTDLDFLTWPYYDDDEIKKVAEILASGKVNYWTGEQGKLFEKEYARSIGVEYGIAVMNGTAALEAALAALDIGPGDEVITTCRTFIASASCAVARGAKPVLADVDPVSQNITVNTIKAVLTSRTKAIVVVHIAGWPCEMDTIMQFAREHKLYVIEDCAQANGALYKGKEMGSWGDIGAFSFCQDKIISTGGEGGMVTTNSKEIWERVWAYKDIGKSYDTVFNRQHPPGFRWLHESFGTNARMTDIQAAIGRIQLQKLPQWITTRRRHAEQLTKAFKQIPGLRVTEPDKDVYHAYYKYYAFVQQDLLAPGWNRDRIMVAINDLGVPCYSGICGEIYLEKAFQKQGWTPLQRFPVAQSLAETSLMFLVHPTLTDAHILRTIDVVTEVMQLASQERYVSI